MKKSCYKFSFFLLIFLAFFPPQSTLSRSPFICLTACVFVARNCLSQKERRRRAKDKGKVSLKQPLSALKTNSSERSGNALNA